MMSIPRVSSGRALMAIGYKYNYRNFRRYIFTDGAGSIELGDIYLSCVHEIYSNVSFCPVVCPYWIGWYFNACNERDNHNRMRQSVIALEEY